MQYDFDASEHSEVRQDTYVLATHSWSIAMHIIEPP